MSVLAVLAIAIGLIDASTASAAPANGKAIAKLTRQMNEPSLVWGGCGGKRYHDPKTHQCRDP